ncbi:hypothetical protein FRC19_001176 [Serendipita sp. 401]|nr:hypothetical protein FRC15_002173 [Serendipita sp. 397]KAG8815230.1 hypothetical protein FRC19_001176 [Serendipita sp. 401]KAG8869682.1 hypothetical protein FRC20_001069 [Serendipita sp. 405]
MSCLASRIKGRPRGKKRGSHRYVGSGMIHGVPFSRLSQDDHGCGQTCWLLDRLLEEIGSVKRQEEEYRHPLTQLIRRNPCESVLGFTSGTRSYFPSILS